MENNAHAQILDAFCDNQPENRCTAVFRLLVQKSRRESTHARPFGGDFELKILRMRKFSSRFLDNQPENCCSC